MLWKSIHRFFSSVKLAMALLIIIFVSCILGVTVWRGAEAGRMIFGTVWFNGILVLLVVNVSFAFFGRIRGRRLTLVSTGMILFHLSFVGILAGIVYNSLFHFRGIIRLTEGETLKNSDPASYDTLDRGRFFDFDKLKGEITLRTMHRDYELDRANKKAAYEVVVGMGDDKKEGIIFITRHLKYHGVKYFNEKEGYSPLVMLYDRAGYELYGAFVPLQSLPRDGGTYLYTSGTRFSPGSFAFPAAPAEPVMNLQVTYRPDPARERDGHIVFQVWPLQQEAPSKMTDAAAPAAEREPAADGSSIEGHQNDHGTGEPVGYAQQKPSAAGEVRLIQKFDTGDYYLAVTEIRYWVAMKARYEPGQPFILASLWVGFGGVVLTFIGRLQRSRKRKA